MQFYNLNVKETLKNYYMHFSVDNDTVEKILRKFGVKEDLRLSDICKVQQLNNLLQETKQPEIIAFADIISEDNLKKFDDLKSCSNSPTFHRLWLQHGDNEAKKLQRSEFFTLDDVIQKVWLVALNEWSELKKRVEEGSWSVEDVQVNFFF